MIRSITGSSSATSDTAFCATYGSALKPGSPTFASASSKTARGIDARARHELRELCGIDGRRSDARRDELVRKHVRRLLRVRARGDDVCPELVEPAGHEDVGVVERERAGDARGFVRPAARRSRHAAGRRALPAGERGRDPVRGSTGSPAPLPSSASAATLHGRVEVQRLLLDHAAFFVDANLACDLALDSLGGEVE